MNSLIRKWKELGLIKQMLASLIVGVFKGKQITAFFTRGSAANIGEFLLE